jgi:polyisoprenoid-binding protein YceI
MKSPVYYALAALTLVVLAGFVSLKSSDAPAVEAPAEAAMEVLPWGIDMNHSNVGFKVRHLAVTNVTGAFTQYQATLELDPADLTTLKTEATVQVASIDTGNENRDNHLRSEDFFAAEQFPQLTFRSTGVRNVQGTTFELLGDLTIRGTTRPVVLEAEMTGPIAAGNGRQRIGLEATTVINRMDYGLAWNNLTESVPVVSENVTIELAISAINPPPQPRPQQ